MSLFKDVAHEFVHKAMAAAQVRHLVDRAVRIARDRRAVTCIIVPHDLQELDAVETPPREHGTVHSGMGTTALPLVPGDAGLRAAADVLNAGKRVAILAGAGALRATDELIEVAERLGAESPRRCWARPRCPTICRSSPAPSVCSARSPAGR